MSTAEGRISFRLGGGELHLDYGITTTAYTESEHSLLHRIRYRLESNPLQEVGQGGDMVAYSRPDLNFVIKFPYDDSSSAIRPRFSEHIKAGFFLGKEYLGGLMAPTFDVPSLIQDSKGRDHVITLIIQQKVITIHQIRKMLNSKGNGAKIEVVKSIFVDFNQRMWERGVLDTDPDWEPNYGVNPANKFMLIDLGGLSERAADFPSHEGIERSRLYESEIKEAFTTENFGRFFRRRLQARKYTDGIIPV